MLDAISAPPEPTGAAAAGGRHVERTRLMVRYKVGNNVTGWAVGLGLSF